MKRISYDYDKKCYMLRCCKCREIKEQSAFHTARSGYCKKCSNINRKRNNRHHTSNEVLENNKRIKETIKSLKNG